MIPVTVFSFRNVVAVFYVCAVLLGMACSEPLFLSDPPPEPTPPKPSLSEAPMVKIESPLRKRLESVPFEDKKLLEPEDSVTESDTSGTVTLVMESIAIKVSPVDTKTAFVLQSPAAGKMEIPPVFVTAPVKEEGGGVSLTAGMAFTTGSSETEISEGDGGMVFSSPTEGKDFRSEGPSYLTVSVLGRSDSVSSTTESAFVTDPAETGLSRRAEGTAFAFPTEGTGKKKTPPVFVTASVITEQEGGSSFVKTNGVFMEESAAQTVPLTMVAGASVELPPQPALDLEENVFVSVPVKSRQEEIPSAKKVLFVEQNSNLPSVFFELDSTVLSLEAEAELDKIIDWLGEERPYIDRIVLEGHCDSTGTEEYNFRLGEKRTDRVKEYLIERGIAVPPELIETVSYGKTKPFSNTDEALNRRVDIIPLYR